MRKKCSKYSSFGLQNQNFGGGGGDLDFDGLNLSLVSLTKENVFRPRKMY